MLNPLIVVLMITVVDPFVWNVPIVLLVDVVVFLMDIVLFSVVPEAVFPLAIITALITVKSNGNAISWLVAVVLGAIDPAPI